MYGNPYLTQTDGKWVAVQFKSTLLRVGTPWAECSGATLGGSTYVVGSIMPILFGGPNLNSVALKAGFPSYDDVIAELSGVTVPVKVVLEVFTADKKTYTDSASETQCYKAGNACPEAHSVCQASYCEMDVWKTIIAGLKGASSEVTVLGSVGSGTTASEYDGLPIDGIYMGSTISIDGSYMFEHQPGGLVGPGGTGFSATPWTTKEACVQHALTAGMTLPFHVQKYSDGYCYAYVPGNQWNTGPNAWTVTALPAGTGTTVSAIGAPLFDEAAVDDADVYVTLASSDLGIWNPFSWYPYVSPSKWAAIVTGAADISAVATLFDRGYGWVYLTSEAGLEANSTNTTDHLADISANETSRK
jgi:hypothetical protein